MSPELRKAIEKLLDVAQEWRDTCMCAYAEDHSKMDAAISAVQDELTKHQEDK